jgi:hypothetical protein
VTAVAEAVRKRLALDAFYEKHIDVTGLSVLGSGKPSDESLRLACKLLNNLLSKRDDVRQELIRSKARIAIIGKNEGTAEIPEYGYREPQADIDSINERARGLAAKSLHVVKRTCCACLAIATRARASAFTNFPAPSRPTAYGVKAGFESTLQRAYDAALAGGILDGSYRNSNLQEYWAEGALVAASFPEDVAWGECRGH